MFSNRPMWAVPALGPEQCRGVRQSVCAKHGNRDHRCR
jgi:hypothetical protein